MQRSNARISVNKLGEYLVATPSRRLSIVKNQKRPSSFIVAYYSQAEDAIAESIINSHPEGFLESKISEMMDKSPSSDWDATRRDVCIEALDYFSSLVDEADFSNYLCERGSTDQPKIEVNGVNISVRPEILLKDNSGEVIGGIKLIFSKNRNAEDDEALYIASTLHYFLKEVHNPNCSPNYCYVIDIFGGTVKSAPKAYKRRMKDIEAACGEMVDTWQRV